MLFEMYWNGFYFMIAYDLADTEDAHALCITKWLWIFNGAQECDRKEQLFHYFSSLFFSERDFLERGPEMVMEAIIFWMLEMNDKKFLFFVLITSTVVTTKRY